MPLPVLTLAQMREWERATWAAGQTEQEVIRQVGLQLARRALELSRPQDLVLILAGPGHNGDDARHARPHLAERCVRVLEVTEPAAALAPLQSELSLKPSLVIDGLFGIGLSRPLNSEWRRLIERVNQAQKPVLAVDVPSGLNAQTGQPEGAAIQAAVTLTIGAPKTGMLAESAWPFVGRLEVAADVGLAPAPPAGNLNWTVAEDFAHLPPARAAAAHKGTYGHAVLLAGSVGYHGAGVLTARAAQRAQPGLLTLLTTPGAYPAAAAQLQAVMVSPWQPETELPHNCSGLLAGPGLASAEVPEALKSAVRRLWLESELPFVVDASALDWLPPQSPPPNAVRVLTPHPGEAARLLGISPKRIQTDRCQALRRISEKFGGAWVVLKGHQTLVGRSEGPLYFNSSGNPYLAQGGSGDVLAGFMAGLLVQPALSCDPLTTIRYAVWRHGAAADELQAAGTAWVVEDLILQLGKRRVHPGF
jgi:ADP-dependent NAD(P)H-hydrate dehydratase / NAD(P)H-hydrate epimerase